MQVVAVEEEPVGDLVTILSFSRTAGVYISHHGDEQR